MNSNTPHIHTATKPTLKLKPASVFFTLWRIGGARPRRRHTTLESALIERGRLRALHPDARFVIYRMEQIDAGAPR